MSSIGFDNQELIAESLYPGLATMALPHYEMGAWAVSTMIDTVEGKSTEDARRITMPCPLIVRESVSAPG